MVFTLEWCPHLPILETIYQQSPVTDRRRLGSPPIKLPGEHAFSSLLHSHHPRPAGKWYIFGTPLLSITHFCEGALCPWGLYEVSPFSNREAEGCVKLCSLFQGASFVAPGTKYFCLQLWVSVVYLTLFVFIQFFSYRSKFKWKFGNVVTK